MGERAAQMLLGARIPLRDGIHLSGNLYLPEPHPKPSPAILQMTPYIAQGAHARGVYAAEHGYPFLVVDVRGRGNSEGVFQPNIQEACDGYDLVEWLAKQPYCNGQVAMWGGSYGGYVQWATAKEFPPHLATIVPTASPCFAVDFPIRNNIGSPYWMQWLTLVWGRASQDKLFWDNPAYWNDLFRRWFESGAPFKKLDEHFGNPSPIFQRWVEHPEPDAYWDRFNPSDEQYARLSLPILTITGSYDGDQPGALAHFSKHIQLASPAAAERHYLVIGPWDHAGTAFPAKQFGGVEVGEASLVDIPQLHLDWYAWTMQGGPKPAFLKKNVAYYVMGADRWRYADSLEAITADSKPYYLHSKNNPDDVFCSGNLDEEKPAQSPPAHYIYDPRDVAIGELESRIDPTKSLADQRMIYARCGKHLVYHTAPFANDVEVSGFFRLLVWLSIDQPDTDFRVGIHEIALDGSSIGLSGDLMRARYREGLRTAKLIETTDPLRYDFAGFTFVSRRIKKGHRLRLVIGPTHSIFLQKNYNSGGVVAEESMADARPVTVKLFHDPEHPSALYIPYGHPQETS